MTDPSSALLAARALLPAWVGLAGPVFCIPAGFAVGLASSWIGAALAARPLARLDADASWVERARVAFPAACLARGMLLVAPILMGALSAESFAGPFSLLPPPALALAVGLAAYLGALVVRRRLRRQIARRTRSLRTELRGELTVLVLMAPHLLLILPAFGFVRPVPGARDCVLLALTAVGVCAIAWYGGLPLARLLGAARPATPRLARAVAAAADRIGLWPRGVWIVGWPAANAVAFPLSQQLAFTEEALEVLDDAELAAVAAHELGHLSEAWSVRLARAGLVLAVLPAAAITPIAHALGIWGALLPLAIYLIALLLFVRLAHRMEIRADSIASAHQGDEGTYARALEKVYRANLTPVVMAGRRLSHPHLYDRLLAAGIAPGYPRPAPPSQRRLVAAALASITFLVVTAHVYARLPSLGRTWAHDHAGRLVWVVALSGGATGLFDLGVARANRGALEEGIAFVRAAAAAAPRDHHAPAYEVTLLVAAARCEDAWRVFETAEARADGPQREQCPWLAQARASLAACPPALAGSI